MRFDMRVSGYYCQYVVSERADEPVPYIFYNLEFPHPLAYFNQPCMISPSPYFCCWNTSCSSGASLRRGDRVRDSYSRILSVNGGRNHRLLKFGRCQSSTIRIADRNK